ncbi:MAG: M23 family metallopeptidase [Treponema sp.]|nr:M23 family metallopeptidase [Treponema sp.]
MIKRIIPLLLTVAIIPLFAFDWPQEAIISDIFFSYFGQLRGETVSTSLIFADTSDIKAADDGYIISIINEYDDDSCFFPSTLGNAVIIAHENSLLTVYGNIDKETLNESLYTQTTATKGMILGTSGNAGWQQGHSSLEFQTIDMANGNAINPRILLPRVGTELALTLTGITLENTSGTKYELLAQRRLPAGIYRVYRRRQEVAMPYKTRVSINGVIVDEIAYDQLIQNGTKLYAVGRKNYSKEVLYPEQGLHLLGEITLTPGRNTLGMTLTDILGAETSTAYSLTIY